MKQEKKSKQEGKPLPSGYRITRKYEGALSGETLVLNLIKAHLQNP